ncbi:MAG TPA: hypothetical protein VJ583_09905 [Nitrososphaeraceae archaeon]|nr:hypothetical protein [Nitrososphaeraceae archaeon]
MSWFISQHKALFKKRLHLKVLTLWNQVFDDYDESNVIVKTMIDSLFGEALLKLSLNIITPEINSQIDKRVLSKYQSFTNPNLSIQVNFQNQ